jgi:hypothetical protein
MSEFSCLSFFAGCFGAATAASAWTAEHHHQAVAQAPDQLARKAEHVTDAAHFVKDATGGRVELSAAAIECRGPCS